MAIQVKITISPTQFVMKLPKVAAKERKGKKEVSKENQRTIRERNKEFPPGLMV